MGQFINGRVLICYPNVSPSQFIQTLRHELQHALDACTGKGGYKDHDCDESACSEVRAYQGSGQCNTGGINRQLGQSRRACVTDGTRSSLSGYRACIGKDVGATVNKAMQTCYDNQDGL